MSCELYPGISRPIDTFVKYFLDVKPYHTKILEVLERYNFSESIDIYFDESIFTKIDFINEPLCKLTGWGVDWDDECGFDSLNCCDLFDCVGGYGLIYNDSDLLSSANIVSVDNVNDKIIVEGNKTYDIKVQINDILNNSSFSVRGDYTTLFNTHSIFLVIPRHTYNIFQTTENGFILIGNRASEFLTRKNFIVYASGQNDGIYNVKTANYDFSSNKTFIEVLEPINNPLSLGIIEIKSGNKNNGIYQVETVSFNGVDTIVSVKTSVKQFDILNDISHGSVQFRTGFIYPRSVVLDNSFDPNFNQSFFKILDSRFNANTGNTELTIINNIENIIPYGNLKLYGYMGAGFDPDLECSTPKDSNIHTIFSEFLQIRIIELTPPVPSISASPISTSTPMPTPTPTPTITPTITSSITATSNITPTPSITNQPTPTPTPTISGEMYPMLWSWATGGFPDTGYGDNMLAFVVFDDPCGYENGLPYHQDIVTATIIGGTVEIFGNSGCGATYTTCDGGQYIDVEGDPLQLISTTNIIDPINLQIVSPTIPEPIFDNVMVLDVTNIPGFLTVGDGGLLADLVVTTNLGTMNWKLYYNNCI